MKTIYAINYVLGGQTFVLCVQAEDRDDAFDVARGALRVAGFVSASLQGTARVASQDDIEHDVGLATLGDGTGGR